MFTHDHVVTLVNALRREQDRSAELRRQRDEAREELGRYLEARERAPAPEADAE